MSHPRPNSETSPGSASTDARWRRALVRGDAVLASVPAVLRHLLVHDDGALFAEDVLARTRGMLADLSRQVALALAGGDGPAPDPALVEAVSPALIAVPGLLAHLHATAIEWQVTEGLQARLGLDPVLSPLVQALVASPDSETGAAAMRMLTAQARFAQGQRQMRLPLGELPPDLVHALLEAIREVDREDAAARAIRAGYDESASRLGLLARLVTGMGAGAIAALSLGHGGLALFATTMAIACDLPRDACIFATQEAEATRLALALRAAGLRPVVIEENLLALNPGARAPFGIAGVTPERACALLAESPLAQAALPGGAG
jgi:hypothetical protein